MVTADASDSLDLQSRYRLLIGNNGQCLQHGIRQSHFPRSLRDLDQIFVHIRLGAQLYGIVELCQTDTSVLFLVPRRHVF